MSLTRVQWYLVEKCAALLHLLGSAAARQGGQELFQLIVIIFLCGSHFCQCADATTYTPRP